MGNNDQIRPKLDSYSSSRVKQKTVRTTLSDCEIVIRKHQEEGWRHITSLPLGGNEVLITFEK